MGFRCTSVCIQLTRFHVCFQDVREHRRKKNDRNFPSSSSSFPLSLFLFSRKRMLMSKTKWLAREKENNIHLKKVDGAIRQEQLLTDRLGTVNLRFVFFDQIFPLEIRG